MDFFRSRGTLLIAGFLISLGCTQFFFSRRNADLSKREATAVGTVFAISGSKGSIYNYVFKIDGIERQDEDDLCRTALTSQTCDVGAKVLVYYVRTPALETRLQDFVDAAREMLFTSVCLTISGIVLIVMHIVLRKTESDTDDSGDTDESAPSEETEDLHIVSRE
jgi:hypothetical protein